jgi:hypothetical protein
VDDAGLAPDAFGDEVDRLLDGEGLGANGAMTSVLSR